MSRSGSKLRQAVKTGVCAVTARSGALDLYRRKRGPRIFILMYHKIAEEPDPLGLCIAPEVFSRQLRYLSRRYSLVSLGEAVDRLEGGILDRDCVVLTFDDGYRNTYTSAWPILRQHNAPATIFVTHDAVESGTFGWHRLDASILASERSELDLTDLGLERHSLSDREQRQETIVRLHRRLKQIPDAERATVVARVLRDHGDPGAAERIMLTWDEIREMHGSGLVTIGGHTLTHPILTRMPADAAMQEIAGSKRLIETRIDGPVEFFAYPNGGPEDFDAAIMDMVRKAGYRAACCTISPDKMPALDLYCLPRTDVTHSVSCGPGGGFSESMFSVKVSGMLDGILFRS